MFRILRHLYIDECSGDSSPCDENADCTNSDGSYSCTCKQGFTGDGTICTGMFSLYSYSMDLLVVDRSLS